MARNRWGDEVVSRTMRFAMVPNGPEPVSWLDEPLSVDQLAVDLPARDVVLDQADGARGLEQTVHPEPEPGAVGQKARETGRLSARRGPKTGR